MVVYIILAAILVMGIFAIIISYKEDHPAKKT